MLTSADDARSRHLFGEQQEGRTWTASRHIDAPLPTLWSSCDGAHALLSLWCRDTRAQLLLSFSRVNMGVSRDALRVAVCVRGPPARLLELVRRSTDAPYFSALADGVRWPGKGEGAPPWTAVRPGGLELLAASTAAMPAKDAQLAAAIAAHGEELVEVYGDDMTPDRDEDHDGLSFHLGSMEETEAGAALRTLYEAEHALLLAWHACSRSHKGWHFAFGFEMFELGFEIEEYELGGDTLRFSFHRYGLSFCSDDTDFGPYEAMAACFADLRSIIVVEQHYGDPDCDLGVLHDGVPERLHLYWDVCCDPEQEQLDRLKALLPDDGTSDDDLDEQDEGRYAPHRHFSFAKFCALGARYMPEARAALRVFDAEAEERLCVHRNHFKHAAAVIYRAYHRAMTHPDYAMCKRRLHSEHVSLCA